MKKLRILDVPIMAFTFLLFYNVIALAVECDQGSGYTCTASDQKYKAESTPDYDYYWLNAMLSDHTPINAGDVLLNKFLNISY
jgi:hypothetical protein